MPHIQSSKNTWEDHYTRKARKESFPARSVFKLEEIQQKFKLIHRADAVLDLGCAPGSWLMYAARRTGAEGIVTGIDLKPLTISLPSHVQVFTADILNLPEGISNIIGRNFHVVMSDMAPSTTGDKRGDAARSFELCQSALSMAQSRLLPGGSFICKIFQGEDFNLFIQQVRALFLNHKIFKPQSCRKASREIYVIGINKQ